MLTLAISDADNTKRRNAWKKGESGNPLGRKIERAGAVDVAALARAYAPEAIKTLVHCLRDPRYKLAAAVALLDRGYGKPHISVHSQSESTVLHLIAAEAVGEALIDGMKSPTNGATIDGDVARDASISDVAPTE